MIIALTAARLLAEIDPLPHPARVGVLVRVALQSSPTELDVLLDDLFGRGPWERSLSLRIASVAGHRAHVGRCLGSAEPELVRRAVGPAVRLGVADDLIEVVADLPAVLRQQLCGAARATGDEALADRLLGLLRVGGGDREAAALLPGCSADVVVDQLGDLAYAVPSWPALARRHPVVFLDHVDRELDATPRSTWAPFLRLVGPGLAAIALAEPDRVLDVLERVGSQVALAGTVGRVLAALARHDPARTLELVLSPHRLGPMPTGRRLWRAFAHLGDDDLVRVARAVAPRELVRLLRVLPPRRRPAIYGPVLGGRDLVDEGVPLAVLDELPWGARHAEASRLLRLRSATTDLDTRLQITTRLPWDEAEHVLRGAVARPSAEQRAQGYSLLTRAAVSTRDPQVVEGLVTSLDRLRNEQDPVRAVALRSLARIPAHLFTDVAADALVEHVRAAVQARDASHATSGAARLLTERLIREGVGSERPHLLAAGLRCQEDAAGHLDHVALAGQAGSLPRAADQVVYEALLPRLRSDERIGRFGVLLDLAGSLGRRAWPMSDLQERLSVACRASDDGVVRRAVGLWLAPPETRAERVGRVLRHDSSTIAIHDVAEAVASRRTDLLDAVFDGRQRGRFATRGVRHVPLVARHCERWVPRQVERYRVLLKGLADDTGATVWQRASAIRELGRVPGSVALLRGFLDDASPQLADAALAALAWTDNPAAALPDLLARGDGDRAHIALSAATRCARFVAPGDLAGSLRQVLAVARVTARKEACRLLAEHRVPGAVEILRDVVTRPGQHRDVRRAVVSSLRLLLDDPVAWTTLAEAVDDDAVATALLETGPEAIAPRHRARYALLVADLADRPVEEVAVPAVHALTTWVRWDPTRTVAELAGRHATDLDRATPRTWPPAVDVLVAAAALGDDAPFLGALARLIEQHRARDLSVDFDAAAGRDLPARQRIERFATGIGGVVRADDATAARTATTAARTIAAQPLLVDLVVRPAVQAVPWHRADDAVAALLDLAGWCAEPVALDLAAAHLTHAAGSRLPLLADGAALAIVRRVVADARPAAGRLGLALLAVSGQISGWPEPHRVELRALRRHPDAGVRLAAVRVLVSQE